MVKHPTFTHGHAGKFLSGMTGHALLAVAFHAAVGGALWLGGLSGDTRPAYPVSDIIMVQVITNPTPDPSSPAQVEKEPEPTSAPEVEDVSASPVEPVIETSKSESTSESIVEVQKMPEPVFEEPVVPVFEAPKKKPVQKPLTLEKSPIHVTQVTDTKKSAISQGNVPVSRFPLPQPAANQPEQDTVYRQQAQTALSAETKMSTQVSYARNPKPVYPQEARRSRQEGVVLLRVEVDVDGRVQTVRVMKSSGHRLLDRAAQRAIKKWKFVPATLGGIPVKSTAEVPVRFSLQDS